MVLHFCYLSADVTFASVGLVRCNVDVAHVLGCGGLGGALVAVVSQWLELVYSKLGCNQF